MTPRIDTVDRLCDAYLDEPLGGIERAAIEGRVRCDPRLMRAVRMHREIAASLQRQLAAPDLDGLMHRVEAMALEIQATTPGARGLRWYVLAAAVLLMSLVMCASRTAGAVQDGDTVRLAKAWSASIAEAVALGIVGGCAVVAKGVALRRDGSGRLVLDRFGSSLQLPAENRLIAARVETAIPGACSLVFETREGPAALLVLGKGDDPRPDFAACMPKLARKFFRREFENLVVYEAGVGESAVLLEGLVETRLECLVGGLGTQR